jgi:eukaryotic-like serine/threonine-protein kinase
MLPRDTVISGRYSVDRCLGQGAMGTVYVVHHVNTGEKLALKLLDPALAVDPHAVERLRAEARVPIRIGSEHVVRVIDADVSRELNVPFLVMELLNGRDLETEVTERGALAAADVVCYLEQVARALERAHALGIVHRDLKPSNLYLTRRADGTPLVKILDFGIAKLTDGTASKRPQRSGVFGTPLYMAPEQAESSGSEVGPAADLWALGLIAFRLLTGIRYWRGDTLGTLMKELLEEPMRRPSERAPQLSPAFDVWFERACDRDPRHRYPSASAMVAELANALGVPRAAHVGRRSLLSSTRPFEPPHFMRKPRARDVLAAVGLIGVVVCGVMSAGFVLHAAFADGAGARVALTGVATAVLEQRGVMLGERDVDSTAALAAIAPASGDGPAAAAVAPDPVTAKPAAGAAAPGRAASARPQSTSSPVRAPMRARPPASAAPAAPPRLKRWVPAGL